MKHRDNCIIKKGWFPSVMEDVEDTFAFVSIDMDLYRPILEGLRYFYPRLAVGGILWCMIAPIVSIRDHVKHLMSFAGKMGLVM